MLTRELLGCREDSRDLVHGSQSTSLISYLLDVAPAAPSLPFSCVLACSYGLNHSLFDIGVYTEGSASPCSTEAGMNKYDWCQQCG